MLSAPLAMRILGAGPVGSSCSSPISCCPSSSRRLGIVKNHRLATASLSLTLPQDHVFPYIENGQSAGISRPARINLMDWLSCWKQPGIYSILHRSCVTGPHEHFYQSVLLDEPVRSFPRLRERCLPTSARGGWHCQGTWSWKGQGRNCPSASCDSFLRGSHDPGSVASGGSDWFLGATTEVHGRRPIRSRIWSRGFGNSDSSRRSSSRHPVGTIAEDGQNNVGVSPMTDLEREKFTEVEIKPTKKLLTLPTILTLARVAAVPALMAVFYAKETWTTPAGAVIFVVAALTDWLDGYLARRMGSISPFGAFLDPVADKLMVAATLVLLCTRPLPVPELAAVPWLLPGPTIAIIGREITMSAVREWAASQGGDLHKAVAVSSLGKIKTASQMIAITLLLVCGEGGLDSAPAAVLGVGLLYIAAGLALWSLRMYMKGIWGSMFN